MNVAHENLLKGICLMAPSESNLYFSVVQKDLWALLTKGGLALKNGRGLAR